MELKWLEDFLSLASTHSFSQSASERNITQSAFSRRIRALEVWLGSELLDRSVYPVALTDEGKAFLETAETVVSLLYSAKDQLGAEAATRRGNTVSITALHTIAQSVLPQWLAMLETSLGPFTSKVLPDNFATCIHALTDGGYDFFMTFYHPEVSIALPEQAYPFITVGRDTLVPVGSPEMRRRLDADEGPLPLLQYSRGSFLGLLAKAAQESHSETPTYRSHVNENSMAEAMRAMARAGHGMAWLPLSLVDEDLHHDRLVLLGRGLPMEIRLYRNAARARNFVERIWNVAQGYPAFAWDIPK